jgi:hypothetical protein
MATRWRQAHGRGTNNKIETMKWQVYGFRVHTFLTLKIRAIHETLKIRAIHEARCA